MGGGIGSPRARILAGLLVILACAAASLPDRIEAFGPGLDPSWIDSLNEFARSPFVFGRDFVFTFGPLGYVLRPLDLHENLRDAFAWRVFADLSVTALLIHRLLSGARLWQVAAAALGFAALPAVGVEFEYQINAALLFACVSALNMNRGPRLATLTVASCASAALAFMNLGVGAVALAILSASWLLLLLLRRDRRAVFASVGAYGAAGLAFARFLFPSSRDFQSWLLLSAQLVRGYDTAMAIWDGPRAQLALALAVLAALCAGTALLTRAKSESAPAVWLGLVPIALSFKHSFVRHDPEHLAPFFALTCALALTIVVSSNKVREISAAGALALLSLITLGLSFDTRLRPLEIALASDQRSGRRGVYRIQLLQDLEGQRSALRNVGEVRLQADRLPDRWRAEIGGETAMIVPWESAICRANQLRCIPYPTLQMYATYTPELDRWASERIRTASPRFIVLGFLAIDGRHPVLDAPEVWQVLLDGYEVVEQDPARQNLLLRKRTSPVQRSSAALPPRSIQIGEWVPVPEGAGWLRAGLELSLNASGWLRRAVYKLGRVGIELRYRSGRIQSFKLVPAVMADGLLIDGLPTDLSSLAALFDGRVVDHVTFFRLVATAPGNFARDIPVRFRRLEELGRRP
jgi:hypothetical protein